MLGLPDPPHQLIVLQPDHCDDDDDDEDDDNDNDDDDEADNDDDGVQPPLQLLHPPLPLLQLQPFFPTPRPLLFMVTTMTNMTEAMMNMTTTTKNLVKEISQPAHSLVLPPCLGLSHLQRQNHNGSFDLYGDSNDDDRNDDADLDVDDDDHDDDDNDGNETSS